MKLDTNKLKEHLVDSSENINFNWGGVTLCLIVEDSLLFIERSETMPSHKGQIAFIGGHKKEGESPYDAAKREFEEESSFNAEILEFLGVSTPVYTSFDTQVVPVIGKIEMDKKTFLRQVKSNGEWDEVFFVRLTDLLDLSTWHHAWRRGIKSENSLLFRPLLGGSYISRGDNSKHRLLWGATARMVWNFLRLIKKDALNE